MTTSTQLQLDPRDVKTFDDGTTQTLADCQGCGIPVWGQQVKGHSWEFHMCAICMGTFRTERAVFEASRRTGPLADFDDVPRQALSNAPKSIMLQRCRDQGDFHG